MKHQDNLMQRQTEIVVRQDELLSRRARLRMYKDHSTRGQVVILCRNDGNKTAQNFYWHLSVPVTVGGGEVWDGLGNQVQRSVSMVSHEERITVITPAWSTTPFIRLGMHLLSRTTKTLLSSCGGPHRFGRRGRTASGMVIYSELNVRSQSRDGLELPDVAIGGNTEADKTGRCSIVCSKVRCCPLAHNG